MIKRGLPLDNQGLSGTNLANALFILDGPGLYRELSWVDIKASGCIRQRTCW